MSTFALLVAASAFVQPFVPPSDTAVVPAPVTIPLQCDAQSTIFVSVSLAGAPARRFLLDTGASVSLVDRALASQLRLAPAGRVPSLSGFEPLVTAHMTVGRVVLGSRALVPTDLAPVRRLVGNVAGIVGADVLRALGRVTIDYGRCLLRIGTTRSAVEDRVPLTWHEGRPMIAVAGSGRLLLDSGASTLIVFEGSRAASTLRTGASVPVRLDRTRGAGVGWVGRLPLLTIGRVDLVDLPAVAVKSWYDAAEPNAPNGLLPPRLFSQVHLNIAEGFVTFAAR